MVARSAQYRGAAYLEAIARHDPESIAIVHSASSRRFTYGSLLADTLKASDDLLAATKHDREAIRGQRIAFLVENGYDYVVTLLACLASEAIAVPLAPSFPVSELRYVINHSQALALISSERFTSLAEEVVRDGLERPTHHISHHKIAVGASSIDVSDLDIGQPADEAGGLMLFTSGTTARPKGVLLPSQTLSAQSRSLIEAWKYTPDDHLLHVLPLHHIHGVVNALLTPLMSGSTIEFAFPFNADKIWSRLAAPFLSSSEERPISFFTVVPTIWSRMLQSHSRLEPKVQQAANIAIQREHLRLNISGSAALPTPVKKAWSDISSGNTLLERFGMTEVGMALSCGLADQDRIDGSVGWPLPFVEARLFDDDIKEVIPIGQEAASDGKERQGEIQLRGPTIFKEYWRNPEATAKEFTEDGWFKTGDMAIRKMVEGAGMGESGAWAQGPAYFIHGRTSADIIKTGGEKVSALEIERELLSLPEVDECAVVGLPSETWGQKVAVVMVLSELGKTAGKGGKAWSALDMRKALKDRFVAYKIPQDMKVVESIPRNAMGKVNKKELVPAVFGDQASIRRRSIDVAQLRVQSK